MLIHRVQTASTRENLRCLFNALHPKPQEVSEFTLLPQHVIIVYKDFSSWSFINHDTGLISHIYTQHTNRKKQ